MQSYLIALFLFLLSCIPMVGQYTIPDEHLVDYSAVDLPLREVLKGLGEKTGVTIAFQDEIIPGDSIVSISVRRERLGKVIDHLIGAHDLRYRIVGDQIVIRRNPYAGPEEKYTISGYVRDLSSGEPLVNANIYLSGRSSGTISNEYGFYSFRIPKGLRRLYISYLGYETGIHEVPLQSDTVINIFLENANRLSEIVITGKKPYNSESGPTRQAESVDIISVEQMNSVMSLGGEPDIMRMAYSHAGVATGADGFGGMSVRGGETNQNLILYDGIPVYNAQHAFGLFSIFNPDMIKSAKLYKGAFPSHYSGRLSSVMDIRTREGNSREFHGNVALGLLAIRASAEGPIVRDKSAFLISIRRSFVDPWIRSLTEYINEQDGKQGSSSVFFFDFNGKFNFSLGDRSKVFLSYYSGSDNFDTETTELNRDDSIRNLDQTSWNSGNKLASVRWNWQVSRKAFLNVSAYRSIYNFNSFDHNRVDVLEGGQLIDFFYDAGYYQSEIEDNGMRTRLDIIPSASHTIKLGGSYVHHAFRPGLLLADHFDALIPGNEHITRNLLKLKLDEETLDGREYELFIEDEIRLGRYSFLNLGYNHLIVETGRRYHLPQPRILLTAGSDKYAFSASWGRMAQYLHNLTNSGLGIPVDVWLPSTSLLAPETAWVATMGHNFRGPKLGKLGFELFYKKMDNLTRYGDNGLVDISSESNWELQVPVGSGKSYGVETTYEKTTGRTDIRLNYTLSRSTRQFDGINNGETFRFRYDRTHNFNLGLVHRFGPSVEFSATWNYASGNPVTIADGQNYFYVDEQGKQTLVLVFEHINNDRLPDYHRLDLGLNIHNTHRWGSSTLSLGLYNIYNRRNPFYRDIVPQDPDNPNELKYRQITILPVLPVFSYALHF